MKTIYPFTGLALCGVAAQAQEKPNFLIIQCDHLTQRVVGAYGQTQGCTLPIDEVASRGVIFSNAYVGCPLSQPSRAALWSGMMPHQTNVRSNSSEPINPRIPENVPTLGSLFSENGYEAVHFGKTHDMGSLRGFKHKEPVAKPFTDPEFPVNNDSFLDVGTCEDAVAYLSNPPEEPFICIADFQNPHNICGFVGANEGVHTDRPISGTLPELPANFNVEDWSNIPKPVQYICCSHRRMTQASHWNEENYRHYIAAFQHYTKMVSKQVDSVLKALYSTPAGKNTIVIIMADHGDGMASHRMVTKHISFYDEMTNVPFIFAHILSLENRMSGHGYFHEEVAPWAAIRSRLSFIPYSHALAIVNSGRNGYLNCLLIGNISGSCTVRTFVFDDRSGAMAVRTGLYVLYRSKEGLGCVNHLSLTSASRTGLRAGSRFCPCSMTLFTWIF